MRLVMTTTLGLGDLQHFGLASAREGQAIEVDADTGEALIKRGWATEAPARIQAVTKADLKASDPAPPAKGAR